MELYILPKELQWAKRGGGHQSYEQKRTERTQGDPVLSERIQNEGREIYERGWQDFLKRVGGIDAENLNRVELQQELVRIEEELRRAVV